MALKMDHEIDLPQAAVTAVEKCRKPVVVAMHGGVVGGGIDLACACDIRYAVEDTFFTIYEVKVGLAADVGTLQRTSDCDEFRFTSREVQKHYRCGGGVSHLA